MRIKLFRADRTGEFRQGPCVQLVAWLAIAIVLGACGTQGGPPTSSQATGGQELGEAAAPGPVNWDNPILGAPIPSVADAAKSLAFVPLIPQSLGTPTKVLVQLSIQQVERRTAAFMFDHSVYGLVVVTEWKPVGSIEEYEARLHSLPERAAAAGGGAGAGHAELVTIRGGIVALLTEPDDRSTAAIRWVENGIVIDLEGPNLQRDEVISVTNAF